MKNYEEILFQYCDDILKGKINACVHCKAAIKRFKSDLKRSKDEDFLFEYHQEYADAVLQFAEELKPGDLNGKTISLLSWQVFCFSNLEGWRFKNDPERKRFRTAYIEVNRKNGKTTGLLLPLILYNFLKYPASESYIVSSRDDLAEKTFKEIVDIINADETLADLLDPKSLAITFKDKNEKSRLSFFCDGGKDADGFKPRFFCLDEYHAFASDKMLTSMMYGMRSKKDAQGVMITTADVDVAGPCYEQNVKARSILNGTREQDDFFAIIYALDETDDFHNPDTWIKANPSLYAIIDPSVIQADIDDAELTPHRIPELKAKSFGIWGGGGEKSWLPLEVWQKNKELKALEEQFEGERCFIGLDLSQVDDLTVYTKIFLKDGKEYYFHNVYIPEETAKQRYKKENINMLDWCSKGIVKAIPGATIDYAFVWTDILKDADRFSIGALGYDKWQSREVINHIEEARPDILLVEIEQSMKKLSPITKAYEKSIKDGKVVDNNPVMLWCINNAVAYYDENGNVKIKKKSKASTQKIDPIISSMMAHSLAYNPEINLPEVKPVDFNTLKALF